MSEKVIGFDLGGTNMRAAVVDRSGKVYGHLRLATPNGKGPGAFVDAAAKLTEELSQGNDITGIGIAVANVVDVRKNRLGKSPNIPDLNDFDFAGALGSRTGLDIYLENDANAAAIGEHWLGAGVGTRHMICVTLGTGVGGGIIVDGETLYGTDGNAGEIGHICVDRNGPPCGCGSNGCLEQYSSGTAIVRILRELLPNHAESSLHSKYELTAKDVYEAGENGDLAAIEAYEIAGRYLGSAMAGIVNVFNPEMIVITGKVSAAWKLFIGPATEELSKRAFQQPAERVKIVRGTLGDDAGVLGAAKRAFFGQGFFVISQV